MQSARPASASPRWYHETWAIIVFGLVCPPLAIFLVARKPGLSAAARALVLGAMGAVLVSLALLELFGGVLGLGLARYRSFVARQRAVFLHHAGHDVEALDQMLAASALYPHDAELGLDAARLAIRLNRRQQAASLLTTLTRTPSVESDALVELARLWMDDRATFDRGRKLIEDALETQRVVRDEPHALVLRARIEMENGDLRSAEYLLRRVIGQFRRDVYDAVYHNLAKIARRQGDRKHEVIYLCESLRSEWNQPLVRADLDDAIAALHLPAAEYRAYERALEIHEDIAARDEARAILERLVASHPGFLHLDGVRYTLATSHFYYRHDFAAALVQYQALMAGSPDGECYLRAYYQAGQCYEKLGQDEQAAATYKSLVDLAPAGTELLRMARAQRVRMRRLGRIGTLSIGTFGGEP